MMEENKNTIQEISLDYKHLYSKDIEYALNKLVCLKRLSFYIDKINLTLFENLIPFQFNQKDIHINF